MNRRSLIKAAAGSAAAATLPTTLRADHRPQAVDLAIQKIEWSTDGGLTWGTGEIQERASVLFRAVVKNVGEMAALGNRPLRVDFRVNGQLVSISDHHRSGLAAGQEIELTANTGPMDDAVWNDVEPGALTIRAQVDPEDLFPSEHDEANVREIETEAVTVSDVLSVIGAIAGAVIGGIPGIIGAGGISALGLAMGTWQGELTATSMIGYKDPPGNGGYFPRRADQTALTFGTTPDRIELAVKRFRNAPKTAHAHWKLSNPRIYGSPPGAIAELANNRTIAKAFLVLHPASQWAENGNRDEFRDLALFADGFFNPHGVAIAGGGRATNDGCGEAAFYSDVCRAAGLTPTGLIYGKVRHACINAGFHGCKIPGWRSGTIAMDHTSALGLPLSLRASPTNGTTARRHGLRALIHYVDGLVNIVPAVPFGIWHDFIARRAKARGAQVQSTSGAWWVILREFIKFGKNRLAMKPGVVQGMRAEGWEESTLHFAEVFILDFFSAQGMENHIMSEFCEILLDHILAGEGGPERPVSAGVYQITRSTSPNLRDRYEEVIELYQAWKEGRVMQDVFVSKVGTVMWR